MPNNIFYSLPEVVTSASVAELENKLKGAGDTLATDIHINLSNVRRMDKASIKELRNITQSLMGQSKNLYLTDVSVQVYKSLKLSGLGEGLKFGHRTFLEQTEKKFC